MLIIETLPLLRQQIRRLRMEGKRVALVPTMGNLHDGHMKLVDEAKARADVVVVSIFVNPMQFDRPEDLARYPRTLQEDCEKLNKRKVDLVFAPSVKEIYPNGTETHTYVDVPGLSTMLEGASRPGHFRGVSTIVSKLFNLVQPDIAFQFGKRAVRMAPGPAAGFFGSGFQTAIGVLDGGHKGDFALIRFTGLIHQFVNPLGPGQ